MSSGDWDLISRTIDEFVEPDALIRTPLPIERPARLHLPLRGRPDR
jgi:hypothetical protein